MEIANNEITRKGIFQLGKKYVKRNIGIALRIIHEIRYF